MMRGKSRSINTTSSKLRRELVDATLIVQRNTEQA